MDEDCRLGYPGLEQVFCTAVEHYVRETEAEYGIGLVEKFFCEGVALIEVFAHTGKLRTLSRESIKFHNSALNSLSSMLQLTFIFLSSTTVASPDFSFISTFTTALRLGTKCRTMLSHICFRSFF